MSGSWFDLSGRVALVTGADVAATSRTRTDLDAAAAEWRRTGRRVLAVCSDVEDEDSIGAMVESVMDHFGQIDILVNNAGVEGQGTVVEMDSDRWERVMRVNLRGPMLCCKHVGPHMIKRRYGKVINVASVMATRVSRRMAAYAASKAALAQLTRTLALEWMAHNVQVNALCPGYFRTSMNEEFFAGEAGRRLIAKLPIRRIGEPCEIEGAAVFLASDATSYVTGSMLYVDGGHSLA